MQTIEMLQTIKWLSSQYSEGTRSILFTDELFNRPPERDAAIALLNAAHEISRVRATLIARPFAAQVLESFNLGQLLDENWPVHLSSLLGIKDRETSQMQELHNTLSEIIKNWSLMQDCVGPVQELTTPSEVINEENFDEILTINIRSEKEITVDSLSKVFMRAHELYEEIVELMGITQDDQLRVIYVASGSSKRFDLRGLGEPIKQLKKLILELWRKVRYQHIEDFRMSNNAILESLTTLKEINAQRENNTLSHDEAKSLHTKIFKSAIALLMRGRSFGRYRLSRPWKVSNSSKSGGRNFCPRRLSLRQ